MSNKNIGIIVGSLRRGSFCRSVAKAAASLAPEGLSFQFIEIGDLPMFNQDFDDDGNTPEAWTKFRSQVKEADGFLFVTPEYNRSMPAVLKNALDVASRPYGSNAWSGKPGAVISATPGTLGAFGANHHLRQVMMFLNILPLQQPEAYLANVAALLDENGELTDERPRSCLKDFMAAFSSWVDTVSGS